MKILKGIQRFGKRLASFFKETRAELKRVVWPSWAQVRVFTLVTLAMIVSTGAVLWGTDGLMTLLVGLVIRK